MQSIQTGPRTYRGWLRVVRASNGSSTCFFMTPQPGHLIGYAVGTVSYFWAHHHHARPVGAAAAASRTAVATLPGVRNGHSRL